MARNKPNPLLAAYAAKMQAEFEGQLQYFSEIQMMSFMLAVNEELQVGPGRAGKVFNRFLEYKLEIAETINEDWGPDRKSGDKELLQVRSKLARRMKSIFSPEDWEQAKTMFTFLRDFWDD